MNRSRFCGQPAHLVLVDLAAPFDDDICQNLQQALDNVLTLVCSLNGPSRIPFFGLYALGNYPEALVPLQPSRGNYSRLHAGLQELQRTCSELRGCRISSCIAQGLRDAISMFRNQVRGLLKTGNGWSQLEVVIFTCQSMMNITKQVEQGTRDVTLENLKKVQVVFINMPLKSNALDDVVTSQVSDSSRHSSDSDLNSLTEYIRVDPDTLSLETYLKSWLHDSTTEMEHLHLIFPGDVVLRCDLQERVLSAAALPSTERLVKLVIPSLTDRDGETRWPPTCPGQVDFKGGQVDFKTYLPDGQLLGRSDRCEIHASPWTVQPGNAPMSVQKLRIIERVPTSAICDSIVYGQPIVARATTCWKIDWDELESNSQSIVALCHLLHEKGQVLLAEMVRRDTASAPSSAGFRYRGPPPPEPIGHFLVFPSPLSTLLIKSVAVRELMLPCDVSSAELPSEEKLAAMNTALVQVEESDTYNPLTKSCGLYNSLSSQLHGCLRMGTKHKQPNAASVYFKGQSTGGACGYTTASMVLEEQTSDATNRKRPRNITSGKKFYSKNCNIDNFPTEL